MPNDVISLREQCLRFMVKHIEHLDLNRLPETMLEDLFAQTIKQGELTVEKVEAFKRCNVYSINEFIRKKVDIGAAYRWGAAAPHFGCRPSK